MRKEKHWRYYCDHCGKSGGSSGHMKNHEAGCTKNPQRHCGMCGRRGCVEGDAALLRKTYWPDQSLSALMDCTEDCPACILAAIIQSGIQGGPDDGDPGHWVSFDFKAAKAAWWKEERAAEEEREAQRVAEIARGLDRCDW